MMKQLGYICLAVMALMSCQRPEKPIPPFDRGNMVTNYVGMGNTYQNHVFFNLDSNKIIKTISKSDWDLAFDCRSDRHIILLNNGRGVYAAATGKNNFSEVNDTFGLKFLWGQPNLNLDSLAFGKWWTKPAEIFILNLGVDEIGLPQGFIKCKPELQADNSLKLWWCKLNETTPQSFILAKNINLNFTYYSLLKNKPVDIEPSKDSWDLWFTQYVKLVYSSDFKISQNYQVMGVLINQDRLSVANDFNTPYSEITNSKPASYTFLNQRDAIGHEWKSYDFNTNSYLVNPKFNYILSINNGFYYKIHFIDFYNELGIKGYPKFEFQKL